MAGAIVTASWSAGTRASFDTIELIVSQPGASASIRLRNVSTRSAPELGAGS